nr:MAG TPA: hypothetical protein [Caudoviricetes sp.]
MLGFIVKNACFRTFPFIFAVEKYICMLRRNGII